MYLFLLALATVSFIHSILFIFIIQKNTELTNKIDQQGKRKSAKSKRMTKQRDQLLYGNKNKGEKRGNKRQ